MRNYSNMKKNKINDICFKLYAPHLCSEPVTESKSALETKLWKQLEKYGACILDNIEPGKCYSSVKSEAVFETIVICINKWRTKEITAEENFSAYFSRVLKNEYYRIKEKEEHCISLDMLVGKDEDTRLRTLIPYKKSLPAEKVYEEKESAVMVLRNLDICWKQAKFPDWYRAVLTGKEYLRLYEIFNRYPDINPERYSFINMEIYNMNEKPKQKDIAQVIGKDTTQLSRALGRIREKIQSLGLEFPL